MALEILSRTSTLERLRELDHRPLQQLGQNFLVDGNIVRKSVSLGQVEPGDTVVEVGPGLGTLTAALLEAGAFVHAVERDRRLAAELNRLKGASPLHLCVADAVKSPLADLPPKVAEAGTFKIIANLPYAISTPWLAAVLQGPLPQRMVLMLQRETAERLKAPVGTKQFGAISIQLGASYRVADFYPVPASCFHPAPEVESALLHLERLPAPRPLAKRTRSLIRQIFQKRRKQLGGLCKALPAYPEMPEWVSWLASQDVDRTRRPETIEISHWLELDTRCQKAEALD